MKKSLFVVAFLLAIISPAFASNAEARVTSVCGYFKSNGSYVSPYLRTSPNRYKFDNYSYRPSQGLFNKSYYRW